MNFCHSYFILSDKDSLSEFSKQNPIEKQLFSEAEKERYYQLPSSKKNEFLFSHCILHFLLDTYYSCSLSVRQKIQRTNAGKWILPPSLSSRKITSIFFNLSHCSGGILLTFSSQPVGCDLETREKERNYLGMSQHFLCPEEVQEPQKVAQDHFFWKQYFLTLWTLKESYIKQVGGRIEQLLKHLRFQPDFLQSILQSLEEPPTEIQSRCLPTWSIGNTAYTETYCLNSEPYPSSVFIWHTHPSYQTFINAVNIGFTNKTNFEDINKHGLRYRYYTLHSQNHHFTPTLCAEKTFYLK